MYIKMDNDKSLIITVPTTIYRGEKNADLITFLIPAKYKDINVADCNAAMRYVMPSGAGHSETLQYRPEMYKDYLQFSTPADTRFTSERGTVSIWLTFSDDGEVVLKTGEVDIPIKQSRDIDSYLSTDDIERLRDLAKRVDAIENEKADSMVYDRDENTLQLTSNGNPIGDVVDMDDVIDDTVGDVIDEAVDDANDVIGFGDDTDDPGDSDNEDSGATGGNNDVIYF